MKTLNSFKREGLKARKDMKDVFNSKVDKLKNEFEKKLEEKKVEFTKQIKMERHNTKLHRLRANNFKEKAFEYDMQLQNEKRKN